MLHHTFADLFNIFFHLQTDRSDKKTQDDLAVELDVSRRTISNWLAGKYAPRSPNIIERIAYSLCLNHTQTDMLLYAVDPAWVRYGTPANVLETLQIVRYAEQEIATSDYQSNVSPSTDMIEREWSLHFQDRFEKNYQKWGVGSKHNGIGFIERTIEAGRYTLLLQNEYHEDVMMGGDSACQAPEDYYMSVYVRMLEGDTQDDGYALVFNEISDECNTLFRVREKMRRASVVQCFFPGDQFKIYLNQHPIPTVRQGETNKLAVLCIKNDHWFYVNDTLVDRCTIPRFPMSRLDVGIIAGRNQKVTCEFQDFRVYVPFASVMPTEET